MPTVAWSSLGVPGREGHSPGAGRLPEVARPKGQLPENAPQSSLIKKKNTFHVWVTDENSLPGH